MYGKPLMTAGLLVVFATTAPGLAQAMTDHECWILFEANDTNGDGRLSRSEIVASDDIPESLEDRYSISFDEFMDACRD